MGETPKTALHRLIKICPISPSPHLPTPPQVEVTLDIAIRVGIERMFVPCSLLPVPCSLYIFNKSHSIAARLVKLR
ncbi:hypothetical protein [Moorena sp. SIO4G3]|uniref:hypothetical protein n=1 Tax=Moorena sp. SIO4G3 TaxID=2607821 RepID=UPI00142BBD93|nr:hypothetical protein [Moorena sp. SIO4G3]NEO79046.1 hypothetical protein [Moorena sp. SIO4G3]